MCVFLCVRMCTCASDNEMEILFNVLWMPFSKPVIVPIFTKLFPSLAHYVRQQESFARWLTKMREKGREGFPSCKEKLNCAQPISGPLPCRFQINNSAQWDRKNQVLRPQRLDSSSSVCLTLGGLDDIGLADIRVTCTFRSTRRSLKKRQFESSLPSLLLFVPV